MHVPLTGNHQTVHARQGPAAYASRGVFPRPYSRRFSGSRDPRHPRDRLTEASSTSPTIAAGYRHRVRRWAVVPSPSSALPFEPSNRRQRQRFRRGYGSQCLGSHPRSPGSKALADDRDRSQAPSGRPKAESAGSVEVPRGRLRRRLTLGNGHPGDAAHDSGCAAAT